MPDYNDSATHIKLPALGSLRRWRWIVVSVVYGSSRHDDASHFLVEAHLGQHRVRAAKRQVLYSPRRDLPTADYSQGIFDWFSTTHRRIVNDELNGHTTVDDTHWHLIVAAPSKPASDALETGDLLQDNTPERLFARVHQKVKMSAEAPPPTEFSFRESLRRFRRLRQRDNHQTPLKHIGESRLLTSEGGGSGDSPSDVNQVWEDGEPVLKGVTFVGDFMEDEQQDPSLDLDQASFNVSVSVSYNVSSGIVDSDPSAEGRHDNTPGLTWNDTTGDGTAGQEFPESQIITNDTSIVIYTSHQGIHITRGQDTGNLEEGDPYTEDEAFFNETGKNGTDSVFRPIRIRAFLPDNEARHLLPWDLETLLTEILRPALLTWSAALRVKPVVGNLTVDPAQLTDNGTTCGPGKHTGLPGITVPISHMTEGLPDTDLILYLSLGFVNSSTTNYVSSQPSSAPSGSAAPATSPPAGGAWTNTSGLAGLNTSSAFVSNATSVAPPYWPHIGDGESTLNHPSIPPKRICTGDYLAAASFCSSDQFDRPTAALVHICIGYDFFSVEALPTNIMTVLHELAHALGFNSYSLAHFRRPDGTPVTKRTRSGNVPTGQIQCTGTRGSRQNRSVALPSPELLRLHTVRGGVRVAEIVTPSVTQVRRKSKSCEPKKWLDSNFLTCCCCSC
jgi:hypothetical protein